MLLKEIKDIYHLELDPLFPKEEVDSFFYMVIEHYLGLERFILALEPNLVVSKEKEADLFYALSQLKLQRPIQYILGHAHFCELSLQVDENVLIPRPETEELVYWILELLQQRNFKQTSKDHSLRILDIGTGSGCIAIALAKKIPHAKVFAMDVSEKALRVAKRNALANNVEVHFIEADILKIQGLKGKYDIIVSNPPYVRELEKQEMKKNVLEHEPDMALFVPNEDPLLFYNRIVQFSIDKLSPGGMLFFEINQYLGMETTRLLGKENFSEIELRKDMFGNHRMLKGVLRPKG